jgi:hypothetical protein
MLLHFLLAAAASLRLGTGGNRTLAANSVPLAAVAPNGTDLLEPAAAFSPNGTDLLPAAAAPNGTNLLPAAAFSPNGTKLLNTSGVFGNGWGTSPPPLPRLGSAWYINLGDFNGRRDAMEVAYRATAMRYMRFPAVRPTRQSLLPGGEWNSLYEHFHPVRKPDLWDPMLAGKIRGEIGCIASHLELLRHIKNTGRPGEVYLLAEDDYAPAVDFKAKLPTVLQNLPPDWDSLRFDCWEGVNQLLSKLPQVKPGLFLNSIIGCSASDGQPITGRPECQFCGGTHAVLVPYEKVERMMSLWNGDNGPLFPLDCMMTRPDFKNYCLQWNLFEPVDHLRKTTSIPKTRKEVTNWHLKFVSTNVTK